MTTLIVCMWFTPVGRGRVRLLLLLLLPPLLLPPPPPPLGARGPCWRPF